MEEYLASPVIRPIVTLVTSEKPSGGLLKFICEEPYQMDCENVDFMYLFKTRKEGKSLYKDNEGILKNSWGFTVKKLIPAVILLLFNFLSNTSTWKEQEELILNEIRKYRIICKGRLVKVTILCLYSVLDSYSDKISSLKKQGEVNKKGIFFCNDPEHIKDASRFKKYIWEASIRHYKDEIERILRYKSKIPKDPNRTFSELDLRYSFKLAFYNEIRGEKDLALGQYKKCYADAVSFYQMSTRKQEELRGFSDLSMQRINCIVLLSLSAAKIEESISLLRGHLSTMCGPSKELKTQRWITDHYAKFGNLLSLLPNDLINNSELLQHSGFYFLTICNYYIYRMKLSVLSQNFMLATANWEGFIKKNCLSIEPAKFIGQNRSLVSPNQQDIIEGILSSDQENIISDIQESKIQHLQHAVDYAFKALKFYNANMTMPRMLVFVTFVLSKLFKQSQDFQSAYRSLTEIYQKTFEWDLIQSCVLEELAKFAEVLGKDEEEITWILADLAIGFAQEKMEKLGKLVGNLGGFRQNEGFFKVLAKFVKKESFFFEDAAVKIKIRNPLQVPVMFDLSLAFSDEAFNVTLHSCVLQSKESHEFLHKFLIGKAIEVLKLKKVVIKMQLGESYIEITTKVKAKLILSPPAQKLLVNFQHAPPGIIGETYYIDLNFQKHGVIRDISLQFEETFENPRKSSNFSSFFPELNDSFIINLDNFDYKISGKVPISDIITNDFLRCTFLFKFEKTYKLQVKIFYTVCVNMEINYTQEEVFNLEIEVIAPFVFETSFFNLPFLDFSMVSANLCSNFFSEVGLNYAKVKFILENDEIYYDKKTDSTSLSAGEMCSLYFFPELRTSCRKKSKISGSGSKFTISLSKDGFSAKKYKIPLPFSFPPSPFILISITAPSESPTKTFFSMSISLENTTSSVLSVAYTVLSSADFLLEGTILCTTPLFPKVPRIFNYNIVGIKPGMHFLPTCKISYEKTEQFSINQGILLT